MTAMPAAERNSSTSTTGRPPRSRASADLAHGQEADFFALLSAKEELTTKDGKPYFRVTFRDAGREVSFPIWSDAPLAARVPRRVGGRRRSTSCGPSTAKRTYGPQLDIRRIRAVNDADVADGFDPAMCLPRSRRDAGGDVRRAARARRRSESPTSRVAAVVTTLLDDNRETLLKLPGGDAQPSRLRRRLSGARAERRPDVRLPRRQVRRRVPRAASRRSTRTWSSPAACCTTSASSASCSSRPPGPSTPPAAPSSATSCRAATCSARRPPSSTSTGEKLLRLEHIIVSHQRLPEWGSPKPPMTPEALLVHYADDMDAKLQMMVGAIVAERRSRGR